MPSYLGQLVVGQGGSESHNFGKLVQAVHMMPAVNAVHAVSAFRVVHTVPPVHTVHKHLGLIHCGRLQGGRLVGGLGLVRHLGHLLAKSWALAA